MKDLMSNLENWRKCSPDILPCACCKKWIISDVPIRVFNNFGSFFGEIAFHPACIIETAEKTEKQISFDMGIYCRDVCEDFLNCVHVHEDLKGGNNLVEMS